MLRNIKDKGDCLPLTPALKKMPESIKIQGVFMFQHNKYLTKIKRLKLNIRYFILGMRIIFAPSALSYSA
jgi:hypothetical protein